MRTKVLLELQYLGTRFLGWQPQPAEDGVAVYDVLAPALRAATGQDGGPVAAGRTDKGVHAMHQGVTFTIRTKRPASEDVAARALELAALRDTINARLPGPTSALQSIGPRVSPSRTAGESLTALIGTHRPPTPTDPTFGRH
eukprot:7381763-Prymnesium_polylepis.1